MLKKIFSDELGRGVFVMLITMNLFWILNFLFHFSMGRLLGPENYGILAVLMSLIYIYSVPTEAIQNLISNYTSKFNIKKQNGKIKSLIFRSMSKAIKISFYLFIIAIIFSLLFSYFVKINFWLILLSNFIIFSSLSTPIFRGVLQGRKKFGLLGMSLVIEAFLKLIFAISFIFLGFLVFGAVLGILIGTFSSLLFIIYFNKEIINIKEKEESFEGIYFKSVPYFVAMFVIILFFSLDIILAKRFFSPDLAGKYAALSFLGKIVFFGTMAIGKTMFPLTSERYNKNKDSLGVFKKAFWIVLLLCFIVIGLYWLFPTFVISILYGSQYVDVSPYLLYSGVAFSFLSLTNLIFIYGLSINALKKPYYLVIFLIIEIVLLSVYNSDISEYILAFMVSNIIMFIGSLFLLLRWKK